MNQLADPLHADWSGKGPVTVKLCKVCSFRYIEVISSMVALQPILSCFKIVSVYKAVTRMMATVMLQAKPALYSRHSQKLLFNYAGQFEKNLVFESYCVANHTANLWSLPDCRSHILLTAKMVWNNCSTSWFRFSSCISLWFLFKLRFNDRLFNKIDKLFLSGENCKLQSILKMNCINARCC